MAKKYEVPEVLQVCALCEGFYHTVEDDEIELFCAFTKFDRPRVWKGCEHFVLNFDIAVNADGGLRERVAKPTDYCDYCGMTGGNAVGTVVLADYGDFCCRKCNEDYVANGFEARKVF